MEKMEQYFMCYPGTPRSTRSSVQYSTYRLDMAREQLKIPKVDVNTICSYVNDFLKAIGMKKVESPKIQIKDDKKIDYKKIKSDNALADKRDIVWMKFTDDGYLGVVAVSNDINFDIPQDATEYDRKKHNSSGILVHQLGKKWNTSFVLVFPLSNICGGYKRGDIERAIGNYLIDKKVPIIDFYSHNY